MTIHRRGRYCSDCDGEEKKTAKFSRCAGPVRWRAETVTDYAGAHTRAGAREIRTHTLAGRKIHNPIRVVVTRAARAHVSPGARQAPLTRAHDSNTCNIFIITRVCIPYWRYRFRCLRSASVCVHVRKRPAVRDRRLTAVTRHNRRVRAGRRAKRVRDSRGVFYTRL